MLLLKGHACPFLSSIPEITPTEHITHVSVCVPKTYCEGPFIKGAAKKVQDIKLAYVSHVISNLIVAFPNDLYVNPIQCSSGVRKCSVPYLMLFHVLLHLLH